MINVHHDNNTFSAYRIACKNTLKKLKIERPRIF